MDNRKRKSKKSRLSPLQLKRTFPHESESVIFIKRIRDIDEVTAAENDILKGALRHRRRQQPCAEQRGNDPNNLLDLDLNNKNAANDEQPDSVVGNERTTLLKSELLQTSNDFALNNENNLKSFLFGNTESNAASVELQDKQDPTPLTTISFKIDIVDLFFKNILSNRK